MKHIERSGVVTAVGASSIQFSAAEVAPCPGCNGRCGMFLWQRLLPLHKSVWIDTNGHWSVGEQVKISINANQLLSLCVLTYLVPTLTMLACMLLGSLYGISEGAVIVLALFGLSMGFLISRRLKSKVLIIQPL